MNVFKKASEIRQEGEKWQDAVERARVILDSSPAPKKKPTHSKASKKVDYLQDRSTPIS